jgi:hypothetical protein
MKKLNQKGFGFWEFFLLLLLILLLLWLFWYVWQQSKKQDESSKLQGATSSQAVKNEESAPEKAKKFLEIPELGIKMELDATTDDAYYIMSNGYAYLSLTSLKGIDDCAADKTSIAAISKTLKTEVDEMTGKTYEQIADKVIGDNAYFVTPAQALCTEQPAAKAKNLAARDAFPKLASTIVNL